MKVSDEPSSLDLIKKIDRLKRSKNPKAVLYYPSRLPDSALVARAIVDAAKPFDTAYLICRDLPFGDFWKEERKDWDAYYNWRTELGIETRLVDFAAHEFAPTEQAQFAECMSFAFDLGWDAVAWTKPGDQVLEFSHDDRIEIYRGFNWRELLPRLEKYGFFSAKR